MVLGCSDEDDFLEQAQEAVRVAELAMEICGDEAGEVERQLLEDCRTMLEQAKQAQAEYEEADGAGDSASGQSEMNDGYGQGESGDEGEQSEASEPSDSGDDELVCWVDQETGEIHYVEDEDAEGKEVEHAGDKDDSTEA